VERERSERKQILIAGVVLESSSVLIAGSIKRCKKLDG